MNVHVPFVNIRLTFDGAGKNEGSTTEPDRDLSNSENYSNLSLAHSKQTSINETFVARIGSEPPGTCESVAKMHCIVAKEYYY